MEGMFSNGRACCKTTIASLLDKCPWDLIFACCWEVALWKARHKEETPESRSQASFPNRIRSSYHLWELRWIQDVYGSQASFPGRFLSSYPLWELRWIKVLVQITSLVSCQNCNHSPTNLPLVYAFSMKYTHNHTCVLSAFCQCETFYMYLCLYLYLCMCLYLYLYFSPIITVACCSLSANVEIKDGRDFNQVAKLVLISAICIFSFLQFVYFQTSFL